MKELSYKFSKNKVRVVLIDEAPFFCISDIGKVLKLTNIHRNTAKFTEGITRVTTPTSGGDQDLIYVSESNLYRLIFRSKIDNAKKFQDWVVEEVLPSIRKTGKYSIPEKLKNNSTKNRNHLTDEWKRHGIKKPSEFIHLTLQEYKSLNFKKGKRKKDFNEGEFLLLNALESMESLKLFFDEDIKGVEKCTKSIYKTANNIKSITDN